MVKTDGPSHLAACGNDREEEGYWHDELGGVCPPMDDLRRQDLESSSMKLVKKLNVPGKRKTWETDQDEEGNVR